MQIIVLDLESPEPLLAADYIRLVYGNFAHVIESMF